MRVHKVTRAVKSRRADRPASDKAELRTVDKARVVRERDLARTAKHRREYRIRIYVVVSDEETSIQRHCKIVIHRGGRLPILQR